MQIASAAELGIPKAYASYDALLADPEIEAIYNPLPNHLHVPWSIRAAEAGKHVLCEKPIALNVDECRTLMEARDRTGVKIGEAFMVRTHPQWLRARELVGGGDIGDLLAVVGAFSYYNRDPQNIRNVPEWGGGALMDIGCYPIQISRFLFGREPVHVTGAIDRDPDMGIDRMTSGLLDFAPGHCALYLQHTNGALSTRTNPWQPERADRDGDSFNAPPDRPCRIFLDGGTDVFGNGTRIEEFGVCDQYTLQGDLFSAAIRNDAEVPTPLEDSLGNMTVIERIFASAAR